jgi:hypothetical protein
LGGRSERSESPVALATARVIKQGCAADPTGAESVTRSCHRPKCGPARTLQWNDAKEVVATSTNAADIPNPDHDDLVPLAELIRQTPGAHPITSIEELRNGAFDSDDELDEFLAFVIQSRHADLA